MQVRRFFFQVLLFATPFLVWAMIVIAIDPFDYFNLFHVVPEPVKLQNAASLNSMMFNMLKEAHEPCENLIIGDSRVQGLSLDEIRKVTGERYHTLYSNALKLNEAVDLFWFANQQRQLKHVVFGINFNEYNEYAYADRVHSVEAVIHNPLLYLFDRSTAQAVYYLVKALLAGKKGVSSQPPMSREAFWNYIVTVRGREHYAKYRHPDALYRRMQDMVAFAKEQGTEVTIIIVPHHEDFQKRVREFGLVDQYLRFKREMSDIGARVIDYDYRNDITCDASKFTDPIHYNDEVGKLIVDEVFGAKLEYGKLLSPAWADQCSNFLF
jgi:hypothetical protein